MFDQFENPSGSVELTDPNGIVGSTGGFGANRDVAALAIGALASDLTARNFDGLMAEIRIYDVPVDATIARAIAGELVGMHTNDAEPE